MMIGTEMSMKKIFSTKKGKTGSGAQDYFESKCIESHEKLQTFYNEDANKIIKQTVRQSLAP